MKKKEKLPLRIEESQSYHKIFFAKYAEKNLVLIVKIKNIKKLEIIVIILENIEFLLKVFVVFHNLSTCYYHFVTYEIAKQFEGQFECLRKYRKMYNFFSIN